MFQLFYEPAPALKCDHRMPTLPELTLAVSATWRHDSRRLDWIAANGLACAFSPNPDRLDLMPKQTHALHPAQYVCPSPWLFSGKEIGHAHPGAAEEAMQLHFNAMEALQGVGEPVMTVHVGLDRTLPLDHHRVVKNLTRLFRYGKRSA
jgi:hypothetical protein